ncbi:MAG: M48 family metalloprotease [Planctomycetes bacterium]|nr:M48 family metalloprotease [Planctomycetota bacterium]
MIKDAELAQYLQSIGARVAAAAQELDKQHVGPDSHFKEDNSWMFSTDEFHLVNSDQLNAFTTGGSHMYVYEQLMQTCRSEDELAAVVAHEFAHVYCRHVQKGMNRQMWSLGGAAALGAVGYAAGGKEHGMEYATYGLGLGVVAGQFLGMGYTRDDEAEADKFGFQFYCRAGWDPARFGDFFQQLIDKGYDKTPEWQSDHPTLSSRVQAARTRAEQLPADAASWRSPPIADAGKFAELKTRAAQVAQTTKKDTELGKAQLLLRSVPSCLLPVDSPGQKDAQEQLKAAYAASQAKKK